MVRIIRVPPALDKFFRPLQGHFLWNHFTYFRMWVLAMAVMWGRRNVAHVDQYLDAEHHRTRFNHCLLVERWDPEAALRQKAQELLRALCLERGEPVYVIIDDSQQAKRGQAMAAIAQMKDPTTAAYSRGHQSVGAIVVYRGQVIPWGIRRYLTPAHAKSLGRPFRKTTALADQLIRAFKAPAGVKVVVLFEAYSRCRTVVQAGREQHVHCASTRKSHRSLFKQGWKLNAGRYGRHVVRRRRTDPLVMAKPHGKARDRFVDAGGLELSRPSRG
jgi:hypothetical protein